MESIVCPCLSAFIRGFSADGMNVRLRERFQEKQAACSKGKQAA
jgi:hypothetical protein